MTSDKQTRREFSLWSVQALSTGSVVNAFAAAARAEDAPPKPAKTFRLWATSDAHVGTDLKHHKRENLANAIRQSERRGDQGDPSFEWDVALHLGDLSGNQGSPKGEEGQEVARQFVAARQHVREQFYRLAGIEAH